MMAPPQCLIISRHGGRGRGCSATMFTSVDVFARRARERRLTWGCSVGSLLLPNARSLPCVVCPSRRVAASTAAIARPPTTYPRTSLAPPVPLPTIRSAQRPASISHHVVKVPSLPRHPKPDRTPAMYLASHPHSVRTSVETSHGVFLQ